ncbi:toprim domain-containing protein [Hymenobacter cellulosilyticus]|uniref:Toprim domain-containing protein n=1 Tax=Hymenobacter cellulosilyticus TaxID=2932248 RepID=A0A8T9QCR8_9BACT|nr:toprim domain-containing protein [Hymenobacter cellulosilyticus]UOQ75267.1 toprim domain-containing protein [Hymenobacter cellulosilyticus]
MSESAIDSLSHFQLKHGQDPKNTLYIATSGTPTEAQVALIQRVIDKQQPREVVLANDRDAGGRQFNINYLNELQPARPMVPWPSRKPTARLGGRWSGTPPATSTTPA